MLRVVLVDDEEIIREGIYRAVEWEELGFEVAGQAEDGEQALQIFAEVRPDLIITDIKMPFIDGLELIERIKPDYPEVYIVIISGHDEFNYAQKALKLGAFDYILKPIDLDYLKEMLLRIHSDYELRKKKESEIKVLREKITDNLPLFQEHFFKDLLAGRMSLQEIEKRSDESKFSLNGDFHAILIVQIDDYYLVTLYQDDQERNLLENSFDLLLKNTTIGAQGLYIFESKAGERVILVSEYSREDLVNKIAEFTGELHEKVGGLSGHPTLTVAVGNIYDSLSWLSKSYKEAMEALRYKYILGKSRSILFQDLEITSKKEFKSIILNEEEIISAVKQGDKKLVLERLKNLVATLQTEGSEGRRSYLYMQILVSSIYRQSLKLLQEAGGSAEEVFNDPLEVYNRILTFQTVQGMIGELANVLSSIIDYIEIKRYGKFDRLIEKSKEYLNQNFERDDLSLTDVARYVNMSTCYFSLIFKQEVGMTFIDYLTTKRIEKAKELLSTSQYKSYEISYMVGYNNPTYFSTIFKKYVGVSPTEYRGNFLK